MITIRQRLVAGLKMSGWTVETITRKYIVMVHPHHDDKFYVGKSGALRHGRTVASSQPAELAKHMLLR